MGQEQGKLEASFSTLVLSIGSSTMMALGLAPDPSDGQTSVNLPMARFNIDLLEVLQAKTKNNLSAEESQFLDNMLNDLRIKFVEKKR